MDLSRIVDPLQSFLSTPILWRGEVVIDLADVLGFAIVLALAWVVARTLRRLARRVFRAESDEERGAAAVAEPLAYWTSLGAGWLAALAVLGVDMGTLRDVLNARLFTISGDRLVTVSSLLAAAFIVALTWGLSRILRRAAGRSLEEREVDQGTVAIAQRLIHYATLAVGLALALDNLGVNLAALFAAGAVFAVGIGFAMQTIAQNFVSGLILLVERSIKPGDVVEVEGRVVRVETMGIRSTVARTRDEEEIIIPNSALVQTTVKNYTLRDSLYRLRASVGVEYGSDMRRVVEVLERTAAAQEWRVGTREPVVLLTEFGGSSVNFGVSVWMNDPWTAPRARSRLHQAIWWDLKDAGITIAFPQLDVHFDEPVEDALGRLPRAS